VCPLNERLSAHFCVSGVLSIARSAICQRELFAKMEAKLNSAEVRHILGIVSVCLLLFHRQECNIVWEQAWCLASKAINLDFC
jgi:hypothetical protein